jgi:hypothetical protein
MPNFPTPPNNNRIGFHYYPDFDHYRESDLKVWLPELKSLGTSWLVVNAPADRAIPENFLTGLINAGIEPILHFQLPLDTKPARTDLELLFDNYARWGVHYVILFDQPNHRQAWAPTTWVQNDLVERFLDLFVPLAEAAAKSGLFPVFPPLKPGGDYWDTAFLSASLQALTRRGNFYLLDRLALSAIAFAGNRPLDWGSGGPERWPDSRPYQKKNGVQDQRGFCIFDWYTAIARAIIGEPKPILLFKLGNSVMGANSPADQKSHVRRSLDMAQALASPTTHFASLNSQPIPDPLPQEVLCGNFWLLAASADNANASQAWFSPDILPGPKAQALARWTSWVNSNTPQDTLEKSSGNFINHPIPHYLVLPSYDWGITDWHLNAARPFIRKFRPMIGFSLDHAALAERVTVIGDDDQFPESALDHLRNSGCTVERISGDGTSIATQLIEK